SDFAGRPSCPARFVIAPPDLGLSFQHLRRRIPVRPFLLGVNGGAAGPDKSFSPYADAVADSLAAALRQIEEMTGWIDDDGARRLVRRVRNILARERRVHLPRLRSGGAADETG